MNTTTTTTTTAATRGTCISQSSVCACRNSTLHLLFRVDACCVQVIDLLCRCAEEGDLELGRVALQDGIQSCGREGRFLYSWFRGNQELLVLDGDVERLGQESCEVL